jgi:hypothetical protein
MSIYKKTSTLAVRHVFHPESWGAVAEAFAKDSARVFGHVAEEATGRIVGDWAKAVAEKVRGHLTDHSELLSKALAESNERAWKALEIGLGGQRFWDRFASAEDQALRDQVRDFLTSALKEDDPGYLAACLKELRQARENGLLAPGEGFILASVADEISPFARFDDPDALLTAECTIVEQITREFQRLGIPASRKAALCQSHARSALAGDGRAILFSPGRRRRRGLVARNHLGEAQHDRPERAGRFCVPRDDSGTAWPDGRRGAGWSSSARDRGRRDPRRGAEPSR